MADPLRVLYVDDEPGLLEIGKQFLEESGDFTVTTVISAPEGIRLLKLGTFDAIVSDYQMPKMDGIQFLVEVRERFGPIPFILFTGRGREEVVIQALNSGADFYLQKGGEPGAQFAELAHKIKAAASSKRADDLLRKSEKRYRHLIEHSNEAIVVAQDGMLKLVNHRTTDFTGYTEQELLSMQFSAFIHPDDRAMVVERYRKRMKGEEGPPRYTFRLSSKDGSTRWVELSVVVIDWDGRPATLNFLTDITERKRADDSLREEQQFSTLLLDSLPGIFYLYTYPENRMVRWNKQHETLLGYTAEEIKGKLGTDLHLPEYKDAVLKAIDEVMEKGQSSVESTLLAKDGRLIPFFFTGIRFETPGQLYFMGIGIDISERKRAEEALRQNVNNLLMSTRKLSESEEKFRVIADYTVNWESWFGADGTYIWVSPSVERFTGYTQAEILAMPDFISTVIAKEDQAMFTERFREAINGISGENFEFRYLHRNGTKHWLNVSWQPIVDMNGNSFGSRASGHDITGRKQAEEALRKSEEKFRKAFFTSNDSVCITRLSDGMFVSINKGFTEITGYTEEDVAGKTSLEINVWKDPEDRLKIIEELKAKGEVRNYEARFLTKSGEISGLMSTSIIELNGVPHVLNITHDITGRKRAEETLAETNAYLNNLLEYANAPIIVWDPNFVITRFNHAFEDLTLIPEQEVIGQRLDILFPKESREPSLLQIKKTLEGERWETVEIPILIKDGSVRKVLWNSANVLDTHGRIISTIAQGVDVTERARAEEELAESEEKFRTLFESMTPGVFYQRSDGVLIDINPAALSMFGLSREQFMGRDSYDPRWKVVSEAGELLPPEQHPSMIALRSGKPVKDLIVGVYNPQTEEMTWLSTNAEPQFRSGEVTPYQVFVTMYDITKRKRAQDALAEIEQRFRQVFNTLPIGMWIADRNGKLLMGNPAGQDIWEANPQVGQDEYRIFKAWRLPSHEPVLPDEWALGYAVNEGRVTTQELLEIEAFNGSHKFILNWAAPVKNDAGEITGAFVLNQDITDSVMSERALQESESFLNILLEAIPIPVFYKDREGRYLGFNKAFENFYGKSKEQLMGKSVFDISPPELAKVYHAADTGLFEKPGIQVYDSQVLDSHGILHDVIFHKASLTDTQGSVTGLIGAILDITERKVAEEALRENEANYRQVINTIDETLSVIDPDGNFLFANNNAALNLSGGTPEDVTGKNIREFVPCGQADLLIEKYRSVVASGQPVKGDIRISLKSGERWFSNVLQPLHYGQTKVPAVLSISLDITERKKAEVALKESEERFKSYIENSPDGVFIADERGCYLEVNPGACRITGYEKEELLAMQISDILPPESTEAGVKHFKELIEYGHAFGELLFRHKDGSLRYWSVDAVRLTPTRFIGFVKDITKRKVAEESLRVANKKLKLLSGITRHDISNQITVLTGYLRMLEKKQPEIAQNEYLLKVLSAANRISAMIQFTKEYEEIGVHAPAWQDCRGLVDVTEVVLGQINLINDLPDGLEVFADPLIVKVFYNLLDNAVRYGGKITTIRFSGEESGDDYLIVGEDDGVGVPDEEKEKIFERGYGKNTGLGLALSREILSITGITIIENGEPEKGARFEIIVPKGAYRMNADKK